MNNQSESEEMVQEQQQEQQQFLQPWQWRYPPPRLLELPPHQKQQIRTLWRHQLEEVHQMADFRNHQLPLARIKKVMKSDEEVKMIASDAPVLLAKACEMLIHDLSLRAWLNVQENNRRTIQRSDISDAIWRTDIYDFLIDIVPREPVHEENDGVARIGLPTSTNIVIGNYIGISTTPSNVANGNSAIAPHYYPFIGPAGQDFVQGPSASAATDNDSSNLLDGRIGAIGGDTVSRSNYSNISGRSLYYPPVGMMDPRFAIGHGWPSGIGGGASSSGPLERRDDTHKEN